MQVLMSSLAASSTGAQVAVKNPNRKDKMLFAVDMNGNAGNIVLQGRIDQNMDWVTINTYTEDQLLEIVYSPFLRVNTDTITGGNLMTAGVSTI